MAFVTPRIAIVGSALTLIAFTLLAYRISQTGFESLLPPIAALALLVVGVFLADRANPDDQHMAARTGGLIKVGFMLILLIVLAYATYVLR